MFCVCYKDRCLNKNPVKKSPNFAQSLFSWRRLLNTNWTSRSGLIYPVIIWQFFVLIAFIIIFMRRRMISETMLDLAAYLRCFYCSWLTNTYSNCDPTFKMTSLRDFGISELKVSMLNIVKEVKETVVWKRWVAICHRSLLQTCSRKSVV